VVIEEPTLVHNRQLLLIVSNFIGPFRFSFLFGDEFGVTNLESRKHELLIPCLLDFMDIFLSPQRKNPIKGL
jgi:hypothetical protein